MATRVTHPRLADQSFFGLDEEHPSPVSESTPTPETSQTASLGVSQAPEATPSLAGFDAWYAGYPRKRCKADALNAYRAALRNGHTHEQLTQARDMLLREAREAQFWPYPATFIRRHLVDYLEPSKPVDEVSMPTPEPFPYHSLYADDSRLSGPDPIPVSCAAQITERDLAAAADFFHTRRTGGR